MNDVIINAYNINAATSCGSSRVGTDQNLGPQDSKTDRFMGGSGTSNQIGFPILWLTKSLMTTEWFWGSWDFPSFTTRNPHFRLQSWVWGSLLVANRAPKLCAKASWRALGSQFSVTGPMCAAASARSASAAPGSISVDVQVHRGAPCFHLWNHWPPAAAVASAQAQSAVRRARQRTTCTTYDVYFGVDAQRSKIFIDFLAAPN